MRSTARSARAAPWMLPLACGLSAANIYYSQPLLGSMADDLGVGLATVTLIVSATQCGYAIGLVFLAPLGDSVENRSLVSRMLLAAGAALALLALSPWFVASLLLALVVGIASAVVQIIVPFAVSTADRERSGRVIGRLMIGLLLGVLLARPAAALLAGEVGWRGVFLVAAVVALALAAAIRMLMPLRAPTITLRYPALLRSTWSLLLTEPVLRRRLRSHTPLFCAFSAFWTCIGFELLGSTGIGLSGVAVFALVGAGGALAAPLAGRLGDRGWGVVGTGAAIAVAALASILALLSGSSLIGLALAAIALDAAVQASLVFSQREVMATRPDGPARINAVFIACFFLAGALASAVAGLLYSLSGWPAVGWLLVAVSVAAGSAWAIDIRRLRHRQRTS